MAITVKIDNPDLEKQLIEFVKQQKQDLEEITIEALTNFIDLFHKRKKFNFKKKNPIEHSRKIEYIDDEDLSNVKPYSYIEDSGEYIHNLRREKRR